jgi:hypothetical protein
MSSTPSLRPSTTSSLLASTKTTTSCVGGRAPPRRNLQPASVSRSRVSFHAFPVQAVESRQRHRRQHPFHTVVNVRLSDPGPNRLHPITQLEGYSLRGSPLCPQLSPQGSHHLNHSSFLLRRIPPPGFPVFVHDSILVSKVWNLQQTQDDSLLKVGHFCFPIVSCFRVSRWAGCRRFCLLKFAVRV